MAQLRNVPESVISLMEETIEEKCRICGEKKDFTIYWQDHTAFYICKECYHTIRGLYIDTLLEKEEDEGISISQQLKELEEKINKIKEIRKQNKK